MRLINNWKEEMGNERENGKWDIKQWGGERRIERRKGVGQNKDGVVGKGFEKTKMG